MASGKTGDPDLPEMMLPAGKDPELSLINNFGEVPAQPEMMTAETAAVIIIISAMVGMWHLICGIA
jgi:hypothetical protein